MPAPANSAQITAAFKLQFHDSFEIACQQKTSVLESLVTSRGAIQGSSFTINDMDKLSMTQRKFADRFSATELTTPGAGTRIAYMEDYDLFVGIEPFDLPKLSAAPDSKYMQLMASAAGRAKDDLIFRQLTAPIMRKTETPDQLTGAGAAVAAGKGTYTATSLPSKSVIGSGTAPIALNKAALIKLRTLFRRRFADDEEIIVLFNSYFMETILSDSTLTNADFMAIQMLQAGDIGGKWMGMTFVPFERTQMMTKAAGTVVTDGSEDCYQTVAFTKSALHFGTGINYSTDVQTRADLRNIKQLSAQMSFGAGRANEDKVVALNFQI
jgi:hypothetical protein